jgi:hypothetical protein
MKKVIVLFLVLSLCFAAAAFAKAEKPNILVIWGDDIGHQHQRNTHGLMGYRTPNIDRIANPRVCGSPTTTRAELHRRPFVVHHRPERLSHRPLQGRSARRQGGLMRRGPDHRHTPQGSRLRHGPVRQEPPGRPRRASADQPRLRRLLRQPLPPQCRGGTEHEDYPATGAAQRPDLPGALRPARRDPPLPPRTAAGRGHRPLTRKRMETVDDETAEAALEWIREQHEAGKPWFCWWNGTRMHFRTYVKDEMRGISGQDEYGDGMVEHDMHIGRVPRPAR